VPLRVRFVGNITVPQREYLDRILRDHFQKSVAIIEAEIERENEANDGFGFRVAAAKKFVFADDYTMSQLAIKTPFLEADVSDEVVRVLEEHREELGRLDRTAEGPLLLGPARVKSVDTHGN
jgi:hypothetical protein